jgi:hypothetical protein
MEKYNGDPRDPELQ